MKKLGKKSLIIVALLVLSIVGVSYAFFDYYMLGDNQKIIAGEVYLDFVDKTDSLSLTNIYPETIEEARLRTDNVITFTLKGNSTITNKDVYYEILINEGDEVSGKTRFKPEHLVFDLIEVDENGNETMVVDAKRFNDLNARRIWVNTLNRNSSIDRTYKLRMWLHEGVVISDTESYADYTTSVFENSYASIKVGINGDLEEKDVPLTIETSETYVENNKAYFIAKISNKDNATILARSTNVDNMVLEVSGTNENVVFSYKDSEGNVVTDTSKTLSLSYNFLTEKTVEVQIFLSSVNDANAKTDVNLKLIKNGEEVQHFVQKIDVFGNNFCLNNGFNKLYDCILASDSLATTISTAKANIEAKGEPNLNDTAPSYTYVEDITYDVENVYSVYPITFAFADSYELDQTSGYLRLFNSDGSYIIRDSLSDNYINYYTCGSNYRNTSHCETVYLVKGTTISESLYTITLGDKIVPKISSSIRSEVGLYKTEDDNGESYVFRGDVTNNNVAFGGYYWKILRTNGDNSIRLIYNGESKNATGNNISINNTVYPYSVNNKLHDPTYLGYMYGKDFAIQTSEETWFDNFNATAQHYWADGYEFDEETESFRLKSENLDIVKGTFEEMQGKYEQYPYTCYNNNATSNCQIILKVKNFTASNNTATVQYVSYSSTSKDGTLTNELSSNAKIELEKWYETNFVGKNDGQGSLLTNYIVDGTFCNDRSSSESILNSGYKLGEGTYYSAFTRLGETLSGKIDRKASLKCVDLRDRFSSTSSKGNGLLNYPIALITVDEVALAGGKYQTTNANFYLQNDNQASYFTMTPAMFAQQNAGALIWFVMPTGSMTMWNFVNASMSLRPVINLSKDVLISSGDGTVDNPFQLTLA